ncbi:MAG: Phenylacetic acid catabolic protein [Asticcacaulis sp.]
MIRLGDGACLSHKRLVKSLEDLWGFTDELFVMTDLDKKLLAQGIAVDKAALRGDYHARIDTTLAEADLPHPQMRPALAPKQHVHSRHQDVRWGF